MVYRECIASRDGLGSAANCLTSYYMVFWSRMLLKAWRGGLACGWSPGSASCGGCDFLHIRRPTGLSLHLGPLQGHFSVMERLSLTLNQDVKEGENLGASFFRDPLSKSPRGGSNSLLWPQSLFLSYFSSHPCNSVITPPACDNKLHPSQGASFEAGFDCGHLC